ncbi:GntR family transcriptional regulator [Aliivibrio sp. S10_S31]|uniref:GntR family transcriptional regulator n=1 Tax=Aliivibrio sp. S10_S31 TaxID=2720224 RepID=UPI001680D05E|nr:GntR family transcriptional regulator [Aliivibrio sp. S10_S31]MBD1568567.1 GntR family transcriptional regulator [Aliivibrio sp. S10_S31]
MSSLTLTDKVSKMIYKDILSGKLKPGQKLVVAELKERYNVGASPIREALVQLSWNKYVKLEPQKGCWVASISLDELKELFESLRTISQVLLAKAIANGNENWELNVLTSFHKLSKIELKDAELEKLREWEDRYTHFHNALLEGAKSPIMYQFYQDISNQITRYRHLNNNPQVISETYAQYLEEHETMMKFTLSRDSEQATKHLNNHYSKAINLISGYFSA